jgi:hypothetical protein
MTAPTQPAGTRQDSTPAPTASRPRLRLVPVPTPGPPLLDEGAPVRLLPGPRPRLDQPVATETTDFGPTWSRRSELPDPQAVGRRLITSTLEAFAGRRPVAQLKPLVSPGLFTALSERRRPRWCSEGTAPMLVSSVRVCEPVDGVAEVSAVVHRGGRAHAVAARLEGIDGRWRCTALQIG